MRRVVIGLAVASVMVLASSTLSFDHASGGLTMTPALASGWEGPMENEQPRTPAADRDTLAALNEDCIRSVQTGDVARFDEILADDFRASLGTIFVQHRFEELTRLVPVE